RASRRKRSVEQTRAGLGGACVPSVRGTTSLQADSRNGKDTWAIGGELYGTARVSRRRDDCHSGLACLLQNLLNNFRSLASAQAAGDNINLVFDTIVERGDKITEVSAGKQLQHVNFRLRTEAANLSLLAVSRDDAGAMGPLSH